MSTPDATPKRRYLLVNPLPDEQARMGRTLCLRETLITSVGKLESGAHKIINHDQLQGDILQLLRENKLQMVSLDSSRARLAVGIHQDFEDLDLASVSAKDYGDFTVIEAVEDAPTPQVDFSDPDVIVDVLKRMSAQDRANILAKVSPSRPHIPSVAHAGASVSADGHIPGVTLPFQPSEAKTVVAEEKSSPRSPKPKVRKPKDEFAP